MERLARLEAIIRGENPLDRNRALLAFIDQLAPGDFEEAVAHFRSLGITESRLGEYALLLSAWAEVDPHCGARLCQGKHRRRFRHQHHSHHLGVQRSRRRDPLGAKPTTPATAPIPTSPASSAASPPTDPARATELLTGMPKSVERGTGAGRHAAPHDLSGRGRRARLDFRTSPTIRCATEPSCAPRTSSPPPIPPAPPHGWRKSRARAPAPHGRCLQHLDKQDRDAAMSALAALPAATTAPTRCAESSPAWPPRIRRRPSP